MQATCFSRALFRRFSSQPQATPLGKIETRKITMEEYARLRWHSYRKKNIAVGLLLLGGVLTVYGYSMYAVNQDPLKLDELLLEEEVRVASDAKK